MENRGKSRKIVENHGKFMEIQGKQMILQQEIMENRLFNGKIHELIFHHALSFFPVEIDGDVEGDIDHFSDMDMYCMISWGSLFIYLSIYLFIYLSIYLFIYLSIYLSIYLYIYIYIYMYIYIYIYLSMYIYIVMCIYIYTYLFKYLFIYLFIYLPIYLFIYLFICLFIYLFINLFIYLFIFVQHSHHHILFENKIEESIRYTMMYQVALTIIWTYRLLNGCVSTHGATTYPTIHPPTVSWDIICIPRGLSLL